MRDLGGLPTRDGRRTRRQVVIRADFQPQHAINFFAFGSQHDHRYIVVLPHHAKQLKAVNIGEHDIQKD